MAATPKKRSARARSKPPAAKAKRRRDAKREKVSPALVAAHGLTSEEYQRILALIGREPSITELGIFSAMWNEHCSYKSSKIHLRMLPTKAPWVIQGPGENAGVIDIGDGLAADRLSQRAFLRCADPSADAASPCRRGRRHRRLRQFLRCADRWRLRAFSPPLRRQLPGQCNGGRSRAAR